MFFPSFLALGSSIRLVRDSAIACAVMALVALIWRPDHPGLAGGVVGGGLLMGLAFWAIAGVVTQIGEPAKNGQIRPVSWGFSLVKFFTRHVILALVAYGMMLRLHLDPVGMLVGVTVVVGAAGAEAMRRR